MISTRRLILVLMLMAGFMPIHAQAADFVTGMNIVNPLRASIADQNILIGQLKAAGVHIVRAGITPDDKGIDFAKRLHEAGIQMELIVSPQYPPNAPSVPWRPKDYPNMWGGHPLSYAHPELSRAYFQNLIGRLDAGGIVLAGLELGNEINWTAFNPEFPLPGEGKNFSLEDLSHDKEGQQIAKGYLQYLKILAALKDVRDRAALNRKTPIISAGLSPSGPAGNRPGSKTDSASINATLQFLRANGMDRLVDAYGIHFYPWQNTAAARKKAFESEDVAECRPANSASGKPCWITEWGVSNKDIACPSDEAPRTALIHEVMDDFRELARQGRLSGAVFFSWDSDPWAKKIDAGTVYRCGALVPGGKVALSP